LIRIALDSNILVYAAGIDRAAADAEKIKTIQGMIPRLARLTDTLISTQAMGETYNIALKAKMERAAAKQASLLLCRVFPTSAPSFNDFTTAIDLAAEHKLQIWDSLILAHAAASACDYLLSEDMQDGFVWRGLTILNPLTDTAERLLFS
jgi:predicted nucleic acid-binding protein